MEEEPADSAIDTTSSECSESEPLEGLPRADYLKEREALIEGERTAAESFDKAMLALSGGVFALSITFIKEIAPKPTETEWLLVAWLGFALALLSTLASFLSSQEAWRMQRKILDKLYKKELCAEKQKNWQSQFTEVLNWASIVSFVCGVVALALFAYLNLAKST